MGRNVLDISYQNLGGVRNSRLCNVLCFQEYGHKCLYSQFVADGNCFIATGCDASKQQCSSIADINASGLDLNRIYCRNAYYIREWITWRGGFNKGPNPCTQITDDGQVRNTFEL